MSSGTKVAELPAARAASSISSSAPKVRATATMWAPARASAIAVARPMPRDAPVTSAIFSASGFDMAITEQDYHLGESKPPGITCWPGKFLLWLQSFLPEPRSTSMSLNSGAAFTRRSSGNPHTGGLRHAGAAGNPRFSSWIICLVADRALDVVCRRDPHDCKLALHSFRDHARE